MDYPTGSPLPEDIPWVAIVTGAVKSQSLITTLPSILPSYTQCAEIEFPNLSAASDVILGKLGYGTCGDCIAAGKPLIYVRREGFAEEDGLLELMKDSRYGEGRMIEMSKTDLEKGTWASYVKAAYELRETGSARNKNLDGDVVIAEILYRLSVEKF